MNDFTTQLSGMFDEVAAGINPRANFDAVQATPVPVMSNGTSTGRRLPRLLSVAAVSVSLLGGGVAAFRMADGAPNSVAMTSRVTPESIVKTPPKPAEPGDASDAPAVVPPQFDRVGTEQGDQPFVGKAANEVERSAELGKAEFDGGVMWQKIFGTAEPGEAVFAASEFGSSAAVANDYARWRLVLTLNEVPLGVEVPIRVTFGHSEQVFEFVVVRPVEPKPESTEPPKPEEPKPQPEQPKPEQPAPVVGFTVSTGDPYNDETYLMRSFWGSAPAGSVVTASSEWGSVQSTAGPKGEWEMRLKLIEVPGGTVVHVRVSANTGGSVFEYDLVRNKPEPQQRPFTANLGAGYLDWIPMKQGLYGTGVPGSVVIAATEFGSADAVVNSKGQWEMLLKMYEVPNGTTVGVRITNGASEAVFEFNLIRPATDPTPIDFTAQAAFVECDSTPPFNEYWGTSTAGATITISSAYGGTQVTSNGDGNWEARVEFPEAPAGETFMVTVTSSKGEAAYSFPLTRITPI